MRDGERYEKRVGSVVDGRWRIDGLLGWGSTSAVYAATHRNGHRAALKILHKSLCAEPAVTARFLREAGIANAIKHRAIVPINDDGTTEEGCAYLVLELLEGETLDALRERGKGRVSLEELAPIAEELMSAIAAVHAAGVVHRDLKPQNVFITGKGQLKLLDFGTARIFDRTAGSPLSIQGLVIGTPAFMSPEQARGSRDEVDAQSDVWSLGAMIFTVLSGEYVHPGRDAHARLLAAASKPARTLSSVAPSVDERVATVVDRALAFAKQERWPDVQSMRVAFRNAVLAAVPTMRDLKGADEVSDDDSSPGTVSMSEPAIVMAAAAREQDSAEAPVSLQTPMELVLPPISDKEREAQCEVQSEAPAVSNTQAVRRVSRGIPLPALVTGLGAMAAMALLVVFFVTGGDVPTAPSAAAMSSPPEEPTSAAVATPPTVAPAASYIVITAPDVPVVEPKKPAVSSPVAPVPPALAPVAASTAARAPMSPAPATTTASAAATSPAPATTSPAPATTSPDVPASTSHASETTTTSDAGGGGGSDSPQTEPKGGAASSANDPDQP